MRNISSAFSRALANDKRDYQNRLRFTLADSTVFDVYNSQLWDDGLHIEDAVSNDNVFQIGAAIINQCTVVLNNIYNEFSEYNFDGAKIVVYTGLQDLDDGSSEEIKLGTYEVDETSYDGSLITLKCLDNMSKFDKAYETTLGFPATLYQMVADACSKCGVTLDTSSLNFPHKDYIVSTKPSGDNTTFRQVISWAAQIACCFARCNVDGNLEIKWYNTGEFDNFTTGIDGGVFDGKSVEWLSSYMNTDIGMTTLSNTRVDDNWFRIDNAIGFEFNGSAMSYLYIASNSRYKFSDSTAQPGSSTSTAHDVNICGRDGQSISIKYQTIQTSSRTAIKIRFHGYTQYSTSSQTREYELEYEIFFTDVGAIVINFITLPTASGYLGTTSIIENNVTSPFTPTTDNIIALYRGSGNTWTTNPFTTGYYVSGDTADGGTFNPWNTGDEYDGGTFADFADIHFIHSSYSSKISTDNVVITGVKVVKKIKVDGASDVYEEYTSGTTGYVVSIEGNDLIDGTHGQDIADWVGTAINGLAFRKASLTHPSDPSIEAGDVAIYFDENDNAYPILVSSTTFTPGNSQKTVSSAETPKKNSAQRFSETTRNYVEIRQRLIQQRSAWEEVAENLSERIDNASGLYCTEVTEQGATKTYYHNKPVLEESDILMLFSTVGFTLSADGGTTWYGMTVDGQMIASILQAIGINADWINAGTITLGGTSGNINGSLIIKDANGNTIGTFNKNGISVKGSIQSGSSISGSSISGSDITIGGSNVAGSLVIKDANGNILVSMNKNGASFKGSIESGSNITSPTISGGTITGNVLYAPKIIFDNFSSDQFLTVKRPVGVGVLIKSDAVLTRYSARGDNSDDFQAMLGTGDVVIGKGRVTQSGSGTNVKYDYTNTKWYVLYHNDEDRLYVNPVNISSPNVYLNCGLTVHGTKSREVQTSDRNRLAYCYEMASPIFGDIGSAIIGEDGTVIVDIDPVFQDFISDVTEYYVFLQNEGNGISYISEKHQTYFVISGTVGLKVAWELKGRQIDYNYQRLEYSDESVDAKNQNYEDIAFNDVMNYLDGGTE